MKEEVSKRERSQKGSKKGNGRDPHSERLPHGDRRTGNPLKLKKIEKSARENKFESGFLHGRLNYSLTFVRGKKPR